MQTYAAKNAHALEAYITAQHEVRILLAKLEAQVEAHQDAQTPEEIHWGHVGDIQHIVDELHALTTQED